MSFEVLERILKIPLADDVGTGVLGKRYRWNECNYDRDQN
jgi:hypothetical protein